MSNQRGLSRTNSASIYLTLLPPAPFIAITIRPNTYTGDANLDGVVNGLDFNAIATNFNQPLPGALPASSRGGLVPDPSGAIVLAAITFVARQQAARLHGHNR